MPVQVSYPGVYVEEIPSTTPTVTGVSTASTAFVDFFARGPMNQAMKITNFADFNRYYGGLDTRSEASYGIMQYFNNGGQTAWIVRVGEGATKARLEVEVLTPTLKEIVAAAQRAVDAAESAAESANSAAEEARTARDDKKAKELESATNKTAAFTRSTSDATEDAAAAALNASAVLNVEIEKAEASGGPLSDQTYAAAAKSAAAAEQAKEAAVAGRDAAAAAESALNAAQEAVNAGQKSRSTTTFISVLQQELDLGTSTQQAADALKAAEDAQKKAKAASEIDEAKTEAQNTAAEALKAAQAAQKTARAGLAASNEALDDAASIKIQETQAEADEAASEAMEASKAALKATDVDGAKKAAGDALAAATKASTAAQDANVATLQAAITTALSAGKESDKLTDDLKKKLDKFTTDGKVEKRDETRTDLVGLAVALATDVANQAAKAAAPKPDERTDEQLADDASAYAVAKRGRDAVLKADEAAANALSQAQGAAQSAKAAAQSAGASEPAAEAQGALVAAQEAARSTRKASKNANAVADRLKGAMDQANNTAGDARTAAGTKVPTEEAGKLTFAATASGAATAAATAAQNASEGIEDAATATSQSAVQAAHSADISAEAAMAAASALDEASTPLQLIIEAANEGVWGNNLQVTIELEGPSRTFSLTIEEWTVAGGRVRRANAEQFMNLDLDLASSRCAPKVVNDNSQLVQLTYLSGPPPGVVGAYPSEVSAVNLEDGADGEKADAANLTSNMRSALDNIAPDVFNLLCLPAAANYSAGEANAAYTAALDFCREQRAFLIIDIPASVNTVDKMKSWLPALRNASNFHGAIYFPRLLIPDPLEEYRPRNVGPSGTMAGIYAGTDSQRGVWKAPAGITATISGADIAVRINDLQNGELNPLGINVLRSFPVYGNIAWGARTLAGANPFSSEWKYINVRRLANYIEESLYQSLKWAVFEPNDEPLWAQIRLQVGSFMAGLFADGAFQGATPAGAYFVRCDATTTTQTDIEQGIVNVMVGFAPVKPAEFVVLQVQQMAGQSGA